MPQPRLGPSGAPARPLGQEVKHSPAVRVVGQQAAIAQRADTRHVGALVHDAPGE